MKALLTAAVCGAMMTTAALADGPTLPSATNWSGGYFGAHAGYGQGDSSITEDLPTFGAVLPAALATTHDADGYIGGLQVGARRQFGQFVVGVELSGSGGNIEGSTGDCLGIETIAAGLGAPAGLVGSRCNTEVNWMATLTGRVGFAFNQFLAYGALGWSVAGVTHSNTISLAVPGFPIALGGSQNDVLNGLAFGAGLEWAFAPNMSLGIEYLRHDLKSEGSGLLLGGTLTTGSRDLELDTVTAKLNIKF